WPPTAANARSPATAGTPACATSPPRCWCSVPTAPPATQRSRPPRRRRRACCAACWGADMTGHDRNIAASLRKRRAAVVALALLLLLLLWRCGHDGVPTGNAPGAGDNRAGVDGDAATPACDGLLEHRAWTGKIAFSHERDLASADGEEHLAYAFVVDVGAELAEKTRRQHRGADYVVQYFHPEPRGRVDARMLVERFDNRGL